MPVEASKRRDTEIASKQRDSRRARILVVEDEPDIASLIKRTLERGDLTVETVGSGTAALQSVMERVPDLIVLDLNLPHLDGNEVFRLLRGRPASAEVAVIMVTCRTSEDDKVAGLELGADDYITKPFGPRELAARVRAVLRRRLGASARQPSEVYDGSHLSVDFDAVSVVVDGRSVRLTRREFELLRDLVRNRNRVVSRDQLLERVWGYDQLVETRSVDVHVGRLRAKLGAAGRQIETVVGLGYRFVDEPTA